MEAALQSSAHWTRDIDMAAVSTPAYIYSIDEVARRIRALKAVLGTTVLISYKACPNYDIISRLPADCGDGVELASRGELHMFAGHRPRHFYVNTPALTESLVRSALGAKASLVIDAPQQFHLIERMRGKRAVQPVTLRLSNRLISQLCPDAPTLRTDQFGMDMDAVGEAIDTARRMDIEIEGIHIHAGPHTFGRASPHVVTALMRILPQIEERAARALRIVNLGGGLEENWAAKPHDFARYRQELERLPKHLELVHEFGRAIFASAGAFATRVIAIKEISGQKYAVCDGGMAQAFLLAQTENMLRKLRAPKVIGREPSQLPAGDKTIIVGSTCSRDDQIGETGDALQVGDVLVFENCGAYFRTYSMNSFLTLGEASVYVY